jgi:hypothetical protein
MLDPKDAAQLSAALAAAEQGSGADRAAKQLIAQIAGAKQEIGLDDSELFEAIAEGTSMKDPLYYTARLIQYLCEYVSPWAVPVVLGLGLWKAFDLAKDLVDLIGDFWRVSASPSMGGGSPEEIAAIKKTRGWKDAKKAYFMDGMNGASVSTLLKTGLLAQLPPYASLVVNAVAVRGGQPAAPAAPAPRPAAPAQAPAPTATAPILPASYVPQGNPATVIQQSSDPWAALGAQLAYKLGSEVIDSIMSDASPRLARDGNTARDGGPRGVAPTNLGLAQ